MKKYANQIKFYEYEYAEIVSGTCIHSFPVHIHQHLCVGVITDGYANFAISGENTVLRAEDCYIVPPFKPHTLTSIDNKEFSYRALCFRSLPAPLFAEDYLSGALSFIKSELPRFSLDDLAGAVHVSKFHLERKFKERVGITPYQFCLSEKIKKIRQGLLSHMSLTDLAFDLGFTDESHLCNTFKRHMGITPLQYVSSYYNAKEAREQI